MSKKKSNSNGIVYSTNPDFRIEEESTPQESLTPKQQKLKVRLDTKQRAGKAVRPQLRVESLMHQASLE